MGEPTNSEQVLHLENFQADEEEKVENLKKSSLLYGLEDKPPLALTLLMGLQHFLTMIGGSITVPFIITPLLCISDANPVRGTFLSTVIFVSGINTFLQTTFGSRLPIVQGPSFSYFVPTIALIKTSFDSCETYNFSSMNQTEQDEVYLERIRMIQGSIAVACSIQAIIGFSGAPPPPKHAINRGLGVEGIGSIVSGLIGSGTASTSLSQNVGAIWITRVANRRVSQACALIMILIAVIGKLGALFVTIPTPVVGGLFIIFFSMITSVGLSNLQLIDMKSTRNLFILGISLFLGLSIPSWMTKNSNLISTTIASLDQVIIVLLSTPMFVGGVTGFILDNFISGTAKERGMLNWNNSKANSNETVEVAGNSPCSDVYDLPFGMSFITRWKLCSYFPASPTFKLK